jgi:tetratricopeptide (TPR) repeat protein
MHMPSRQNILVIPCIITLLTLAGGCSLFTRESQEVQAPPPTQDTIDSSCAYYYFLMGSRAEYDQRFNEALEAYQKAVICDSTANYISEKIPILLIKMGQLQEAEKWLRTFVAEHPDENTPRLLLADICLHNGNLPDAIFLYQEALGHDPENETALLRLGLLYSQQKEFKQAEDIFLALLKKNEKSYFANLYLARIFTQTRAYEQATVRYESALTLNWSKDLVVEMAEFYNQCKNFDKALALYRSILSTDKTDEQAGLGLVQTFLLMDQEKEAFAELARIRSFSKNPGKIDLIEVQIFINRGKLAAAEKMLHSIIKKKRSSQAEYLLAVVYLEQKKPEMALSTLRNIGPKADEYEESLFLQIRILRDMKHLDQAMILLEKLIADNATRKPIYYALLSSLSQEIPDLPRSLSILADGINQFPDNEQLLFEYAILLEKSGNHDQAMTTMEKILVFRPNHPEALNFIGYTWADENKNLDKALVYIKRALVQKPDNGFIRDSLGWVYFRLGDFHRSKEELEKAIALEPRDPHIFDHLGDAFRALGLNDKALDAYTKALELLTEEKEKVVVRGKIEALKISH